MSRKEVQEIFRKDTTRVKSISFHPHLPVLVTGNHCGTIYVWNYEYGSVAAVLREHTGSVRTIKFHPSGELFASAGDDKVVRVWNYKTREKIQEFHGHTDYIRSLDFHPTRPWIVTGSDDSTIKVWNYYTGEALGSTSGHSHYVMAVLFLDSTHIVSGSLDHTICLWDCSNLQDTGRAFMVPGVVQSQSIDAHDRGVNTLFFKDGVLLSGADDKDIRIWQFNHGSLTPVRAIYSQEGNVTSVLIHGENYVGVSEDGMLSISSNSGKPVRYELGSRGWAVAAKGDYLAVGTDDGLILYRQKLRMVYHASRDGDFIYAHNHQILSHKHASLYPLDAKDDLRRLLLVSSEPHRFILQYASKYEIVANGKRISEDSGQAAITDDDVTFKLVDGCLFRNGKLLARNACGALFYVAPFILLADGKKISYLDAREENERLSVLHFTFNIDSIIGSGELIAFVGANSICLYNHKFILLSQIEEKVMIVGCCFMRFKEENAPPFIYSTIRQLKYYYNGVGTIVSLNTLLAPISLREDGTLTYMAEDGVESMSVQLGEIKFRSAVLHDDDILSVINDEQLPGKSPLKHLIDRGKGMVALPYIKDAQTRFALFVSENRFEEAFEVCDTAAMYSELAIRAMRFGAYDVAEKCLVHNEDHLSLFFLYLSTKQLDKMDSLVGDEIEVMVKVIKEDRSLFKLIGTEDLMSGGDVCDKSGKDTVGEANYAREDGSNERSISYSENEEDEHSAGSKEGSVHLSSQGLDSEAGDPSEEAFGMYQNDSLPEDHSSVDSKPIAKRLEDMALEDMETSGESNSADLQVGFDGENGLDNADDRSPSVSNKWGDSADSERSIQRSDSFDNLSQPGTNSSGLSEISVESAEKQESEHSPEESQVFDSISVHSEQMSSQQDMSSVGSSSIKPNTAECSDDSAMASNRTSLIPHTDSEIRMSIFDPSLLRDVLIPNIDAAMEEAMSLTTAGKFPLAIEQLRNVGSAVASRMVAADDFKDIRAKIGTYLWGLCVDVERRKIGDPARAMQMACFFASLPLDAKHSTMAKTLAANLCFKNQNYKTAKDIARMLPRSKVTVRIMEAETETDRYPLVKGELCVDTLTVEDSSKSCLLCFVKSKMGDVCGACTIGILE